MVKKVLITGVAGQDGSYLTKLLLDKGYEVYGATRRNGSGDLWRHDFLGISKTNQVSTNQVFTDKQVIDTDKQIVNGIDKQMANGIDKQMTSEYSVERNREIETERERE
ncbi:MAG: GDP-mannose 4,6-dehydratase, partial [Rickettsiales bacterium]|nr:GDP-mannose 4,6-dehydratase [Rickettsiales bacterium]